MNRRALLTGLAALAALWLPGCSRADRPAEPVWGKQACAHCAMIVDDKRYAAQALLDGERAFFDDIGCMVAFVEKRGARPQHAWVRDESRDAWLEAESARYRRGAKTPMDYGFGAGAEGPLAFEELRSEIARRTEKRP